MTEMDKALYDKKIVYLDYLERGEKVKNGGFVKWESKGGESRVQIRVRGLYPTDTLQGEILLVAAGKLHRADRIGLQFGAGEYAGIWKNDNLAGTGLSLAECDGVQVQISDKRILRGQWRERAAIEPAPTEAIQTEAARRETEQIPTGAARQNEEPEIQEASAEPREPAMREGSAGPEIRKTGPEAEDRETRPVEELPEETAEIHERETEPVETEVQEAGTEPTEPTMQAQPEQETDREGTVCRKPILEPASAKPERTVISGDKWEQLSRLYPKIHPFADKREFLSLTPRDFVVLARSCHILVQNSFLLHGYYNYGHVVLTRTENRGEETFYLGVPGVYFEREKQAALMFGFEGFEAANEQAEEGGFGYYMKRVEI